MGEEPRIIREVEEGDRIYLKGFGSTSTSQAYKNFATTFALNITNAQGYDLTQDAVYYEGEFLLSPGCDLEVFRKTKTIRSRKGKTIPVLEVRMIHPGIEFSDKEVAAAVESGTEKSGGKLEETLANEHRAAQKQTRMAREKDALYNFLTTYKSEDTGFKWYDDGAGVWKLSDHNDQAALFKAFVLEGEEECKLTYGTTKPGPPA